MRLVLFLGLLAFINTCQDDDGAEPIDPITVCPEPSCINYKINEMMSEPLRNPKASVTFIRTKTTLYYYIPAYCCDFPSVLLDHECNVICNPDGGIAARGSGNCPELKDEIERYVIWEDTRQ